MKRLLSHFFKQIKQMANQCAFASESTYVQRLLDLNAFLIFMILAQRVEFHTEFRDKFN